MKIDPNLLIEADPNSLISQFIDYHISIITSWVQWVKLKRSMTGHHKILVKNIASNGMFIFSELKDEFLTDYDKKEKKILTDYINLIRWLKETKISEATLRVAVDTEIYGKRKEVEKMVKAVNDLATDLLGDCDKVGYVGDSKAFLEVLANQTATEVIAMYIRHAE